MKRLNLRILISALIISGLLFSAGLFTGYAINREKLVSVEDDIKDIVNAVQNLQLHFLFFDVLGENSTCPLLVATLSDINKQSYEIGSKLTDYGSGDEIQDYNSYIDLKREYSRLLTGYWLLANKVKDTCELNASTVVYFFSSECERCDDQGFILTYLKRIFEERILIFALDADLAEPSIQILKTYFNITSYPALIVDGELHQGFYPKDELEKLLHL